MEPRSNFERPSNLAVGTVYNQAGTGAQRKLLSIYKSKGNKYVSFEVITPLSTIGGRGNHAKAGETRHVLFHAFQNWMNGHTPYQPKG